MDGIVIQGNNLYTFMLSLWRGILQAVYHCLDFTIFTVNSGSTVFRITPWTFLVWFFLVGLFISAIIKNAKV